MKKINLFVFCWLSLVASAADFRVATEGQNLSLIKVALPRADLISPDETLTLLVYVSEINNGEPIAGNLTLTLSQHNPFEMITSNTLLKNFDVENNQEVQVSVRPQDPYGLADGSRLLCASGCDVTITRLMYDVINEKIENLRILPGHINRSCTRRIGKFGFVNKSSNTKNQSFLKLKNTRAETQQIRISRDPTFQNASEIGLFKIAPNERLFLPISVFEDAADPRVIKPISRSTGNHRLFLDRQGDSEIDLTCSLWISNEGSLQPIREVEPTLDRLIPVFAEGISTTNKPLLNFLDLHRQFVEFGYSEIRITAADFNGQDIPGYAIIRPTSAALRRDTQLVNMTDLRFGNTAKGITSQFDDQLLEANVLLQIQYEGPCDYLNSPCEQRVQLLYTEDGGAVRDFSWSLDHSRSPVASIISFFNKPLNNEQESYLLVSNTENYPNRIVVSDTLQVIDDSLAVIELPAKTTRLISSRSLLGDATTLGLAATQSNRQLTLTPLVNGTILSMNLVRDKHGRWHNLTLPFEISPSEFRR